LKETQKVYKPNIFST